MLLKTSSVVPEVVPQSVSGRADGLWLFSKRSLDAAQGRNYGAFNSLLNRNCSSLQPLHHVEVAWKSMVVINAKDS